MKISTENIMQAISQHYRFHTGEMLLTEELLNERLDQVSQILSVSEDFPGFSASEAFAIAYIAAQLQISEDSK